MTLHIVIVALLFDCVWVYVHMLASGKTILLE